MPDNKEKAGDFEIAVTLGESDVIVTMRNDDEIRKKRDKLFRQLRYQRGISTASEINITDSDVQRLLDDRNIDYRNINNAFQRAHVKSVIRAVKSFHHDNLQVTWFHAFLVSIFDDVFTNPSLGGRALRSDIAKLIGADALKEAIEEHFAEPEDGYEPKNMPSPVLVDPLIHGEKLVAWVMALLRAFPDLNKSIEKARLAEEEAEDVGALEGEEVDESGFHASELD